MTVAQTADDLEDIPLPERRDRPVTLLHRLELAVVATLDGLFRVLGVGLASAVAGKFMRYAGPLIRPVSRKAERNLALVYPDWTQGQIRAVVKDIWENVGRTAAEFAHLQTLREPAENPRLEIIGKEKLDAIRESGKPVIFFSGHLANWELGAAVLQRLGLKYAFVYRAANNPLTDEYIIKVRARSMTRYQIPKGKRGGRALVDALKGGRSLAMVVDQKLNSGISVPFLGIPAMTAPAPARLSLKYDAPLVQISIKRLKGARFKLTVRDPVDFEATGDAAADTQALTLKINEALERDIRANPGQWLWFHRRWPKELYTKSG